MMRLRNLAGLAVVAGLAGAVLMPGEAMAVVTCPEGALRKEANSIAECNIAEEHETENLMTTVNSIINVVLGVLGIVAVGVIIVGAITFITSQGDAAKVTKGRNTILYGLIGLIVALLAFAIVNFVLKGIAQNSTSGGGGGGTPSAEEAGEEAGGEE